MGSARYPNAKHLNITADGGGRNGGRLHLWKVELQRLADELGLVITVCHLPPRTSKWTRSSTASSRSTPRTVVLDAKFTAPSDACLASDEL
jgi:hypothetical protein